MQSRIFGSFLVTYFFVSPISFATSNESEIKDPFLLPFGPKNGDIFNTRERTCSEKPHPLGIEIKLGEETFGYAFVCKGGYIALSKEKDSLNPTTTNMISSFWTEDVNANHWVNPFVDQLCSEIFHYEPSQIDEDPFWEDQNVIFSNYFSPDDVVYNNICQDETDETSADLEEFIKSESVRSVRWVNTVYDLPNPSAYTAKDLTLTGNIFRRIDTSKDTLDTLTSFVRKVTLSETFEATWSFVVTWFRTPLTRPWDGWLSQQTIIVCEKKFLTESVDCYVIWFYEAAATAPCDGCQDLTLPLDTGFYVNGTLIALPRSLEGKENTTKLLSNSNIGVPGVYLFHINDGTPEELDYASAALSPCVRNIEPKECDLFSDKVIFKLTGVFCHSQIPKRDDVEIVFQGAYSSKIVRPERVDQLKGDIEAFFPFWGVVEPAVVYLLVNGKQKPDSMVQVKFVSLLDTYGLPPFIAIDELSKTDQIQHGWPEDFPFKSDNLLIRSVIVVGAKNVSGGEFTAEHTELTVNNLLGGILSFVKADNTESDTSYKIIITAKEFRQFPKKDDVTAHLPVILKRKIFCEDWIEEQEKINISHCLDRFRHPYCSGGLCVDYSCPANATHMLSNDDVTLEKLSWHEDPCCPSTAMNGSFSAPYLRENSACMSCETTPGADYCIESMSFPCRDGNDPSKQLFHISNKCCYTSDDVLITNPVHKAGKILLHPAVRHDFARYYKSEIEPYRACCGQNVFNRTHKGVQETSCDAYHRLRPVIVPID